MSATVCTCIRAANLRDVAVPDPDCPACTQRAEAAHEAAATAASVQHPVLADRALTIAARILLAVILAWIFTTDDQALGWVHVIFGLAAIPLAYIATPLPKEHR